MQIDYTIFPRLTAGARHRYFGRMTDTKNPPKAPNGRSQKKAEELSSALRANLAKRKQQARARKDTTTTKTTSAEEQD